MLDLTKCKFFKGFFIISLNKDKTVVLYFLIKSCNSLQEIYINKTIIV